MTTDTDTDTATATGTATTTQIYRIYIKASPERIWEAIVSPEWSEKYYYGTRVDYDLRPGGAYSAAPGAPMLAGFEAMGMEAPAVIVDGEEAGNGGGGWDQILSALKTVLETGEVLVTD